MSSWLLDLPDFKRHLNYTKPGTTDDGDLMMAAALGVAKVEELCGHIVQTTVTGELVRGSGYALAVDFYGESLTSLATYPGGAALTAADFRFDGQVLSRKDEGWIQGPLSVTYVVGWATAPDWATFAARMIGAQIWKTQLRPNPANPAPAGFLVPRMAEELMAGHLLAPGGFS